MPKRIIIAKRVEGKSKAIADALRNLFREKGIFVVNLIGSPGAGKTSLLEAMAPRLRGRAAVIEGDLATDLDRERIERCGLPAAQINTLGACHLDAEMVRLAVEELPLDGVKLLFIENVGNLVCPASFDIGEDVKVSVVSVTEGEDKPAKYPSVIAKSSAMIVTKLDLLPYVECDLDRMERDARSVNPRIECFRVCAKSGDGVDRFLDWIQEAALLR